MLVSAKLVSVKGTLHICRDPDDDIVLECAREAGAEIIVTGDQDLLELREFEGISILSAEQYVALPDAHGEDPHS